MPRRTDNLRDRHFERMRITLSRSEGAKLAGQNADVRIIDVTIENIGGAIPVFSFADDIGDQTECVDVSGSVELYRFLVVNPFCCDNLLVNRTKRRRNEAGAREIFHRINLTQDDSPIKLPANRPLYGATPEVGTCCNENDEFCPPSGKSLND